MPELKILQEGYFCWEGEVLKADSTIVLIKSDKKIIVDTGGAASAAKLLKVLSAEGIKPEDIDLVINTHNHPDHVWNNYLFKNALVFEAGVYCNQDGTFSIVKDLKVAEGVELVHIPGHTSEDHAVLVKTDAGVYAIVGDLIMSEEALKKGDASFSVDPEKQKESQKKILERADFIVPGHGKVFKV